MTWAPPVNTSAQEYVRQMSYAQTINLGSGASLSLAEAIIGYGHGDPVAISILAAIAVEAEKRHRERQEQIDLATAIRPVYELCLDSVSAPFRQNIYRTKATGRCMYCSVNGKYMLDGTRVCKRHIGYAASTNKIRDAMRTAVQAITGPLAEQVWRDVCGGSDYTSERTIRDELTNYALTAPIR